MRLLTHVSLIGTDKGHSPKQFDKNITLYSVFKTINYFIELDS